MEDNKWGAIGSLRFFVSQDPKIDPKINCANGKHSHMGVCTIEGYFDMCSECGIDITHLMNWKVVPKKKRRMKIARKFRNKFTIPPAVQKAFEIKMLMRNPSLRDNPTILSSLVESDICRRLGVPESYLNKTKEELKDLYDGKCEHGKLIVYRPSIFATQEEKDKVCNPCSWKISGM